MPSFASLLPFLAASFVLLLTPGPAVLYIVTRSVDQGRKAGLVSVLGIETGNLLLCIAAAFGLSAILLSSALAFNVVKLLGAAYLIYIGVRKLITPVQAQETAVVKEHSLRRIFSDGLLVAALNPKTALFYVAFLPQFIDPALGSPAVQTLVLGLMFSCMAIVTDGMYAILSGTAGNLIKNSVWYMRFQRYVAGSVFILLGLVAAFAGSGKQ